jgi:integrase-like protein
MRRRVTAPTKISAIEAMNELRQELGQAPRSTKTYTVKRAFEDWLADRLPGRSEKTSSAYRSAAGPVVERIGHRPLTKLTSSEVRLALDGLTSRLSTRTLTIARQSLERAVRFAMNHDRVARNVVTKARQLASRSHSISCRHRRC